MLKQLLQRSTRLYTPFHTRFTLCRSMSSIPVPTTNKDVLSQSPNQESAWSEHQRPKADAFVGPRFEQTDLEAQPNPLSAMELINEQPVTLVHKRVVACDGGGGALGHPKVYINLDTLEARACGYCGNKFQLVPHHH